MKQIIGSAGSGKSFVLADKVAEKLTEGREVAVLSFDNYEGLCKKINFFLDERGWQEGDESKLTCITAPTTSLSAITTFIIDHTSADVLFVDVPTIINVNIKRPYWASISSYLDVMRSVGNYAQTELWMSLQSNPDGMAGRTKSTMVVDEEESKHEVVTLDTITEWVGKYSKSEYSK
jgi:hypothetical protein